MALGGGTFSVQNKEMPGAYINFVSLASADTALSDRGVVTMPLELDWGVENEIFEVTNEDFEKNCVKIFGYDSSHEKMKGLRDLFLNARTLYAFKLTSGGKKASNHYAEALYPGARGNDLKISIEKNVDDEALYVVKTILGTMVVDEQSVQTAQELNDNDFVRFVAPSLSVAGATPLAGGENGEVNGNSYQTYLDKIEPYTYNTMGVVVTDPATKSMFNAFTKRMRDEMGIKFQLVLHNYAKADYYGTISVKNIISDEGWSEASLVYWVTGASAGCAVNKSNQNRKYDGSFTVEADYTQNELKKALKAGEYTFHKVGPDVRVLDDINSKTSISETEGEIFKNNQTIRVIDQIANDIAVLFNTKYLGIVPNDAAGRISLWTDIVKHHEELQSIRAIENFSDSDISIDQGISKRSVVVTDSITVVNSMSKLYMTVTVA